MVEGGGKSGGDEKGEVLEETIWGDFKFPREDTEDQIILSKSCQQERGGQS